MEGAPEMGGIVLRMRESLGDLPDPLLVERAQRGDMRAFEGLMRRYNRRLLRVARGVLQDDSAAEDAVQEAYLSAFTHLEDYRASGNFGAWLARIALNEALMLRRRTRTDTVSLDQPDEPLDGVAEREAPLLTEASVTYDYAEALNARQLLERAIDGLQEDFRMVFILRRIEQMTVSETATALGINEATVRTRLYRAQRLLRADVSRRMLFGQEQAFDFGASRCDRIVAAVLARLSRLGLSQEHLP